VVASVDAPTPRSKPASPLDSTPAPITLAALDRKALDRKAAEPPPDAAPDDVRGREWGESWLAPSRPRDLPQPRSKPSPRTTLVASLAPSAAPAIPVRLSTSLAPTMTGYADPGQPVAGAGRLLDGTNTPLAGMLADAERLSALSSLGVDTDASEDDEDGIGDTLADGGQSMEMPTGTAAPATLPATRPIVTASLSPAAFLPLKREVERRFRAILFAPAHTHVFEPTPDIVEKFEPGDGVDHGLGFAGALFATGEVGAFAPMPAEAGYNPATLRVAQADRRRSGGIMGYAKRMFAWIMGD
jgi:hypothetical protein